MNIYLLLCKALDAAFVNQHYESFYTIMLLKCK